jgi:hypothetical protein
MKRSKIKGKDSHINTGGKENKAESISKTIRRVLKI